MCRFKEVTSTYPTKVTVISFSFKRRRFEGMHASNIHIPAASFHYIGVDPPASTGFDYDSAAEGEANTVAQFETDPYLYLELIPTLVCKSPELTTLNCLWSLFGHL